MKEKSDYTFGLFYPSVNGQPSPPTPQTLNMCTQTNPFPLPFSVRILLSLSSPFIQFFLLSNVVHAAETFDK
uniref:Uncharacterized protein n=1 Tax=Strigamia maritima TaxID=126957 RepID=T1IQN6_STRMM